MAIESVNGMMSLQAQSVATPKPVPIQREAAEFDSVQATDPAAKIDSTTKVVENSKEKGDGKDSYPEERQSASAEQIKKAVEKINQSKIAQSEAIFGIHEGTNRVTIKIVDKKTKETIKELPPEKTLDMIAKVWEMAGLLVDEKR